jgi:glycosyltransferase involved in cell wall biosynthesis
MIGIGITTYNRNAILDLTLEKIREFAPKDCEIVIVDDGSKTPNPKATYRFKTNQGTPIAKNKCLEILYNKGCEHFFLFDSDCFPIVSGWEKPYIESKEPHLNYTFKYSYKIIDGHKVHENPNGCMMYYHRSVLDKVGGVDTGFKFYGYWHGAFSNRIYNAGLTSAPFIDVIGSDKLFCSMDQKRAVQTSRPDRRRFLAKNKQRYIDTINSKEYHSFKTVPKVWYSNPYSTKKNIGKALNDFCELIPYGDWICLQDGDMMYLTPDWGVQIEQAISMHGDKYSLMGCLTNRLGRPIQINDTKDYDNHDIKHHYAIAKKLSKEHFGVVEDITNKKYVAGLFMLFPKSVWLNHKFEENNPAFDDAFSKSITKKGGKLGLMKGLYVYHAYRIWSKAPRRDRGHLL